MRFYFSDECDERCYDLDYHLCNAKDNGVKEVELYEAIPEKVDGYFLCRAEDEVTEDGYCGKSCTDYSPKNGISGMCRHKSKTFYAKGKKVKFKVYAEQ